MVVMTPLLSVITDGTGVGVHEDVDKSALVVVEEEEEEVVSGRIGTIEVDEVLEVVGVVEVEVLGGEMDEALAVVAA